ncbi:ATP-binding protein [Saccharothrix sp. ALI-22-I]|uniref:ATP-binding protein n=1 Tax=Saccharothrix sp. ALI-22-I TaxID=1933778 RepID=UPI0015C3D61E|nr:LuxR C-terminal-related transcriptional regulator [Saccharothrix sp. ALI-22-I]
MSSVVRQRTSSLPLELSSFVGRRREVDEVRRLLSSSRLVTLTGPGGVGKTRLALEVTNAVRRAFPDGVVVVELDQLRDPELVPNSVAVAVGLRENADRTTVELMIEYLASRRLLLVLDNSEHLVDAVAELAAELLQRCRELRILATSREWLGIQGEVALPVPPLTLPDPDLPFADQDLIRAEAVALFVERAASIRPGFTVGEHNGAAIVEICQRLDGLPLAIELAAARLRALSEKDILARLADQPHLLTTRLRHVPARQQTLRACIEWSHGLCSPEEQLLWARLSVFAGAFELDAVEEVCAGDVLDVGDVVELLASLMDKSILVREQHGDIVRYRMLETIREFGMEQLERTGERADLRRRHRDWYLELVERAQADWVSPKQVEWFGRLDREHSNIQAAMAYCLGEPGEVEPAMRMLAALFHFYWWGRGWTKEGRLWLSRALDQPSPPTAVRARALLTDGALALGAGDMEGGLRRLEEAEGIAGGLDDPTIDAHARWVSGCAVMYSGDLPGSIEILERGLAVLPPGVDLPMRLNMLLGCAISSGLLGDSDRANACHEESLRITGSAGECFHRSWALWALGLFAMQQGDHNRSAELYRESIRLRRDLRDLTGFGWSVESLAWTEAAFAPPERVATLLGIADRLWEIMGRPLETYQHQYPHHVDCERVARERLGRKRFEAAFERGRVMSTDDAVAFALGEVPLQTATVPTQAPRLLTRREWEIAELIAEGLTSKNIATRLVISVRTAETHTENILTKLGFTSRAQIATWVAEQRAKHVSG